MRLEDSRVRKKRGEVLVFASILGILGLLFWVYDARAVAVSDIDSDGDGLSDVLELAYYTDPSNPDSDGDGYADGIEVDQGYAPLLPGGKRLHESDTDGDGLNDWLERWFGSDIGLIDSDGDGYDDYTEVMAGYDPANSLPTPRFRDSRKIVVQLDTQRLYYYVDGVKIMNMPVSTGNPGTETPSGTYEILRKIPKKDYRGPGYFVEDVEWSMMFLPQYYLHAAYWHNDFGVRTHSHGCVNLTHDDAKELYRFIDLGVPVIIEGKTPVRGVVTVAG